MIDEEQLLKLSEYFKSDDLRKDIKKMDEEIQEREHNRIIKEREFWSKIYPCIFY